VAERVVDELAPGVVRARVDAAVVEALAELALVTRPEPALLELLDELEPLPRRGEVDLVPRKVTFVVPIVSRATELDELLDPRIVSS
jgi:hypothetical protein